MAMLPHCSTSEGARLEYQIGLKHVNTISLDPENPFEAVLIKMVETNRSKKQDYAGDDHPNQNFYDSAYQLGLTAGHSVENLIATKQARLRILLPRLWRNTKSKPNNESVEDTLLDRAVYSVIALTIYNEDGYLPEQP